MKHWQDLIDFVAPLRFEPHDIASQLDARGHYAVELRADFPLLIKLFHYTSQRHTRGTNDWNCFCHWMVRRASAWATRRSN